MVATSQAALGAIVLVLAPGWCLLAQHGVAGGVSQAAMCWVVAAALAGCAVGALVILGQRIANAIDVLLPGAQPGAGSDAIEAELRQRARFWACALSLPLGAALAAISLLTCAGMFQAWAKDGAMFLERTLELGSGVSPLSVVLIALVFVYCLALTHASRLRVLGLGAELVNGLPKRYVLFRAHEDRDEVLVRERALYEAALLPGGIRYSVGVLLSLGLPMVIVWHVRPSVWYRMHDFTLENTALSLAMALGIAVSLGATVFSSLQLLRLFRHLLELMSAFASSDMATAFAKLPAPLRRTVAEQLAHGPQDIEELRATLRTLRKPVADAPVTLPRQSLPWTPSFAHVVDACDDARKELSQLPFLEDERARLRLGLATFVAFGLLRWVKQFRFMMWLVTTGTATLMLLGTSYVFSVRHLLLTLFAVVTLLAVVAGGIVFVGLERDRVLSSIGGTEPGKVALQGNLLRILGWGVLPVLLAIASYYPQAIGKALAALNAVGVVQ
jgi:hypothetical protein